MIDSQNKSLSHSRYTLFPGLVAVLVMLGVVWLGVSACTSSTTETTVENSRVNWLADSDDICVLCHNIYTPGIVEQFGYSTMAAAGHRLSANPAMPLK